MNAITIESVGATEIVLRAKTRAARLTDLTPELEAGTELIYEATRQWYDSAGDGTWPQLAESTIQRKASQGFAEPERILYAEGNLYESATSPSGPYSFRTTTGQNDVLIGVDWNEDGWQIPVVHYYGTDNAGASHNVHIPARPIWPAETSHEAEEMRLGIGELLLRP
jgi:hypothetical protein